MRADVLSLYLCGVDAGAVYRDTLLYNWEERLHSTLTGLQGRAQKPMSARQVCNRNTPAFEGYGWRLAERGRGGVSGSDRLSVSTGRFSCRTARRKPTRSV